MNKYPIVFVRDRLLYLLVSTLIIGLGTSLMLLKQARYPEAMDDGTIVYFIVLSLLFVVLWLVVDYIRQKNYYKELMQACTDSGDVNAAILVQSPITREQMLVADVLERQHRTYLNELGSYRRQQEMHNHFVLQWVHQMKTPISAADMLCQEAMQRLPVSKGGHRQLAASIQEETDRMSRSLELLLYTARLDKFEMDLHIRRIPLHDLVRSVVNGHKRLCIRHSTFPLIEGEAWVETDEKWMRVVLSQFVSNAIKYSKSKPGAKQLHFRIMNDDKGECHLSITDEGTGIPPHDLPRIFDPFFTGENGRALGESTGMGLYVAKEVCGRLGHKLSASSELHGGTTMTVTFQARGIHLLERR